MCLVQKNRQVVFANIFEVAEQLNAWVNSGKFFIIPLILKRKKIVRKNEENVKFPVEFYIQS